MLNAAIEAMNLAKEISCVFGSASIILTMRPRDGPHLEPVNLVHLCLESYLYNPQELPSFLAAQAWPETEG